MGVVDAEYIVHYNRPTLGGSSSDDENTDVREFCCIYFDLLEYLFEIFDQTETYISITTCVQVSSQDKDHRVGVSYHIVYVSSLDLSVGLEGIVIM